MNPVFVLGASGCNSLGVARGLGRRRIPVFVVDSRGSRQHRLSRYGRFWRSPPPASGDDRAARFLADKARRFPRPPVLIPTNDDWTLYSLAFQDQLEACCLFTTGPLRSAQTLIDKAAFYRAAGQFGVDHPRTIVPRTEGEALAAASEIGYPCLLKPAQSTAFWAAHGLKCFRVTSAEDLACRWRRVGESHVAMLVQELIPGSTIYMWYGYYDRASRLVACCGYWKRRQFPPDFGTGCLVETGIDEDRIRAADRILAGIGHHGIVEPEFKYDSRDRRWKIIEINARTSTQNRLPAAMGLDMEYLAYRDAIGAPLGRLARAGGPMRWSESHKDLTSAFADPRMTAGRWLASRRGRMVYAFFAGDDPLPALVRLPEAAAAVAGTILRRGAPALYVHIKRRRGAMEPRVETGQ